MIRHSFSIIGETKESDLTPLRAIRFKCIDCSAGSKHEVRFCPVEDCPLFPYRFGKSPGHKGKGNPKHFAKKLHENSGGRAPEMANR